MLAQAVGSAPRVCGPCQRVAAGPQQRPLLRLAPGSGSLHLTSRQQRRPAGRRAAAARASLTGSSEEQAAAAAPPSPPADSSSSSGAGPVEAKPDIKQTMADLDALLGIDPEKEAAEKVRLR